jgi:hypothetical protein
MKFHYMQKRVVKFAKRLTILASAFFKPIAIFRMTGILPIKKRSFQEFSPIPYKDQAAFPREAPRSIRGNENWNATPTSPMVMGHLLKIKNGLVSCSGYVLDDSGCLIEGASHRFSRKIQRGLVSHPYRVNPRIVHVEGTVATITASNQDAYFHWLFDLLPRLKMLDDMGVKPEKVYLQSHYRFQRETLDLLGMVSQRQIINCQDVSLLSASTLIVPCHEVMDGREFPAWVIDFVRSNFLPKVERLQPSFPKRVYISRADALFRRVLNEQEILPVLEEYGFTPVKLEKLSFQDQIILFRDAESVVLPHGSGLANLVFCTKGIPVIELLPAQILDHGYRLSRAVGVDYYFLSALPQDSRICEGTSHSGNIPYDFSIRPQDLIEALRLAGIVPMPTDYSTQVMVEVKQDLTPEYVRRPAGGLK